MVGHVQGCVSDPDDGTDTHGRHCREYGFGNEWRESNDKQQNERSETRTVVCHLIFLISIVEPKKKPGGKYFRI
jgi:hypothetical protein